VDSLHGAWHRDDAHFRLLDFPNRFRADTGDAGLSGFHHRHTGAFLGHQQDHQALEMRDATPVGIVYGFILDAIPRDAADKLSWAAADRFLAEFFHPNGLDVLLRHQLPFLED